MAARMRHPGTGTHRTPVQLATLGMVLGLMVASFAACTDVLGPGGCEVIYVVSQSGTTPDTGLRIRNQLSGGVDATVEGSRIVGAGANMAPGACEIWGLFPGRYTVTLQQCQQDTPGSSECGALFGRQVVRSVDVPAGQLVDLSVDAGTFQ